MTRPRRKPVVLCFSGLDPSGGAGIQADIEAIASQGCHAAPIVTALTVQDSQNVQAFETVSVERLTQQASCLMADIPIAAIKIGMLGSPELARAIGGIVAQQPDIPLVLDPILAAGGGGQLAKHTLQEALLNELIPRCHVMTPNSLEAQQLTGQQTPDQCSQALLDTGCEQVLVTGTHLDSADVTHRLYRLGQASVSYSYPRLDGEYHGSGCTLAASLAAQLARQTPVQTACQLALDYTYQSIEQAYKIGRGQLIPNRLWKLQDD